MRFSAYPFDLITYRPEGTVYFVTDTLTAMKRFVFLSLVTDTLIVLINLVFLTLVTDAFTVVKGFVLLASTVNRCCQFYMSV